MSCRSIPTKISFEEKENMPEYYKQYYSLIEKNFNKKKDSVYIYVRGGCFKEEPVVINKNDTITLEFKDNSYKSQVRAYPSKRKWINVEFKKRNFKIRTNPDYFYTNICYSNDTLRVEYYNYPFIDIIR